jgi:hypothetical protein
VRLKSAGRPHLSKLVDYVTSKVGNGANNAKKIIRDSDAPVDNFEDDGMPSRKKDIQRSKMVLTLMDCC